MKLGLPVLESSTSRMIIFDLSGDSYSHFRISRLQLSEQEWGFDLYGSLGLLVIGVVDLQSTQKFVFINREKFNP